MYVHTSEKYHLIKKFKWRQYTVSQRFNYFDNYIASTEHDVNIRISKLCAALNSMNTI